MNTTEEKQDLGFWNEAMAFKHQMQIAAHEAAWGSPLGVLRQQPTQQQYEQGRRGTAADRRHGTDQGTRPKGKSVPTKGKGKR